MPILQQTPANPSQNYDLEKEALVNPFEARRFILIKRENNWTMEMRKQDNNPEQDIVIYGNNLTYMNCDKLTYATLLVKLFIQYSTHVSPQTENST